jgi:chromosomal replication initiator protein
VTHHDTDVVSTLRLAVAEKIGQDRFELWFGTGTELVPENDRVCVEVPNQFTLDWLRNNFRRQIEAAVHEVIGADAAVEFRVNRRRQRRDQVGPSAGAPQQATDEQTSGRAQSGGTSSEGPAPDASDDQPSQIVPANGHESISMASAARQNAHAAVIGTGRRRYASLETFVVGDCNRVAHASAAWVTKQLGSISPLFVYGPTGVGKSHILEGMYRCVMQGPRRYRCVFLSAEQFTSFFVEALQGKGLPSFRRRYRDVDLLVVEDVQFFSGKQATQAELQHTIDTLARDGRQLAFSADRPPSQLGDLGPELVARFSGGLVCGLQPPDLATRLNILSAWAHQQSCPVPDDVLEFMARRITGDVRQLRGALNRLQATSEALQLEITMKLATESLRDVIHNTRKLFRLEEVERAVCEMFEVDKATLKSNRRAKSVTQPRMLAMWLARKYTRAALAEIGDYFGRKSHATVVSAQKTVDRWLKEGQSVQLPDSNHAVDEAIRQLEARLRAS